MRIALSAGHNVYNNGVFDPGSIGHGQREADITKATVKLLKPLLESLGHTVDDITPYNQKFAKSKDAHRERANRVNKGKYDLYLDLHVNAGGGTGPETIVYSANNKAYPVARKITNSLAEELGLTNRRGVKANSGFWSVSMTVPPSIIIESAFIDTKKDMEVLTPERYAKGVAKAFGEVAEEVDKKHWAEVYYESLNKKGVHIDDKRFDDNLTRGESFALLDRLTDFVEEKYNKKESL